VRAIEVRALDSHEVLIRLVDLLGVAGPGRPRSEERVRSPTEIVQRAVMVTST
jgi:hypothetical protein